MATATTEPCTGHGPAAKPGCSIVDELIGLPQESATAPAAETAELARWGADAMYRGRGELVPGVSSIAVLRANAVGDFVVALPALTALRRAYPHATITLLGRDWHADFLRLRPSPLDDVIVLPPSIALGSPCGPRRRSRREADAMLARLRERRFDLALQLHGGGRYSNPFLLGIGARVTAGLRAPGTARLDRCLPYRGAHPEVLRLLETVALVGACGYDLEPRIATTALDHAEAASVLPPDDERPLVVLQPGCTDPRRAWPPESFAAVGDAYARRGALVVLNGTAAEAARLDAVAQAMKQPCRQLAGTLSVGGLLGLLSRARLLVSNDTGPAHLARAIGVPSVTICSIANHASYGPMSSDRHAVALSTQLHCPRCGQLNVDTRCPHDDSFVASVKPQRVLALAEPLWEEVPP